MVSSKFSKIAFAAMIAPVLLAQVASSSAAAKPASAPQAAEREDVKCKKSDDLGKKNSKKNKRCAPLGWAEPDVARANGFFPLQFASVLALTAGATLAVASNSKNCGKGNNSGTGNGNGGQNNGNCPASP